MVLCESCKISFGTSLIRGPNHSFVLFGSYCHDVYINEQDMSSRCDKSALYKDEAQDHM